MNDVLIGILLLFISISAIILLIKRPPKSEYPGMPTLSIVLGSIIFIIMGILLIIGKIKL